MTKSEVINAIEPHERVTYPPRILAATFARLIIRMRGTPAPNQGIVDRKPKLLSFSTIVAAFAIVFTLGGHTVQAATCSVPTVTHPTIQSAVSDPACDPINVAVGAYFESVTIARSLTLNGAQAGNPVAGRTFAVGESTVTGVGVPVITINANNVTIDGFSLTNPFQDSGILIKTAGDSALITNNIIENVGGVGFSGNTQGVYLEHGPDNVRVVNNRISRIQGIASSNGGVLIGDSIAANPSVNTLISGNSIAFITSNRGAYGIHVNNGNGSTANSGLVIRNNAINNLTGVGWIHAIGLEANTPGVLVSDNSISNFVTASPDAIAVWFEANPSFSTGHVNQNNFNITNLVTFGIAVQATLVGSAVDGTCNWWNAANGPGPVGPGTGAGVGPNVTYSP